MVERSTIKSLKMAATRKRALGKQEVDGEDAARLAGAKARYVDCNLHKRVREPVPATIFLPSSCVVCVWSLNPMHDCMCAPGCARACVSAPAPACVAVVRCSPCSPCPLHLVLHPASLAMPGWQQRRGQCSN